MTVKELYEKLGANYEEAKTRLMNDMLIERFILKFAHEYKLDELNEAYKNHDNEKVFALAHSFKGVLGNLSLTILFNLISDITEETRNKANTVVLSFDKKMEELNYEFKRHIDAILDYERSKK